MNIELRNFFKYYSEDVQHHVKAIEILEAALAKDAPHLLDEKSEWVKTYRNQAEVVVEEPALVLPVPYYPQTDNYRDANRTCNSSSCAMCLEYFKPGTLEGPKGDDEYIKTVFNYGDTTDHAVQTKALEDYGVKSSFSYNLNFDDLDRELTARRPVVIGILHRGTIDRPTGGHMVVVIGKKNNGDYICHDPFGSLNDGYTTDVYNGKSVVYTRSVLSHRWTPDGPNSGWGRIFYSKVEAQKSGQGVLPKAGVELIKEFEGLHVLKEDGYVHAYPDPLSGAEPITIGWGSTYDLDGSRFKLGDKITREKADILLETQLRENYLKQIENDIPYWDEMNDNQHGALLSFAYNLGARFYGSPDFNTITRVLRDKEWDKVPDALYLYRNPGSSVEAGLARRRIAEGDLWST
jgi:GH24 family phage-related lysozyme (muramidase)